MAASYASQSGDPLLAVLGIALIALAAWLILTGR
jgi:hypothetical protein